MRFSSSKLVILMLHGQGTPVNKRPVITVDPYLAATKVVLSSGVYCAFLFYEDLMACSQNT